MWLMRQDVQQEKSQIVIRRTGKESGIEPRMYG